MVAAIKRLAASALLFVELQVSWSWTSSSTPFPQRLERSCWAASHHPLAASTTRPNTAATAISTFHYDPFFDDDENNATRPLPYASIASFVERNASTPPVAEQEAVVAPDPMTTTPALRHLQSIVASFATSTTGNNGGGEDTALPLLQLQYDEDLATYEHDNDDVLTINSLVFVWEDDEDATPNTTATASSNNDTFYILALISSDGRVNVTRLEHAMGGNRKLSLAPPSQLVALCGHAAGCIPPVGLWPAPAWTVVDAALLATTTTTLIGGGGLLDQSLVIQNMEAVLSLLLQPNVTVAHIAEEDDDAMVEVPMVGVVSSSTRTTTTTYFAVHPDQHPPDVVFSFVGRLQAVRRMAKELVFCDIVAPDGGSWKHDDTVFPVQLIAGATVCARQGSRCLAALQPERLVLVQGVMGTSTTSVENWQERGMLDIVVHSFTVLEAAGAATSQQKKRAQQERQKRAAFATNQTPIDPAKCLRLSTLYPDTDKNYAAPILVHDMATAQQFSNDVGLLLRSASSEQIQQLPILVGIDAEWLPTLLSPTGEPRPALVLQIALHDLRKVYLLDVQTLFRPLLQRTQKIDKLEKEVAFALGALWESKRLIKVGFQVVDDLRHLAASFPHMEALHFCNAVLEVSLLGKKVIRRARSGNSRAATASLAKTVQHFFADQAFDQLDKSQQCSDWSQRPLTDSQLEYAAIDAAVAPVLVERMLTNMTDAADFFHQEKLLTSCRFVFVEDANPTVLKRLKAKRVVGSDLVVSQYWTTGDVPPGLPNTGATSGGAFRDTNGVLQVPSNTVSLQEKRKYGKFLGTAVGTSKTQCVTPLLASSLPTGARLDFFQRSGFIEFVNGVALFVNLGGSRARSYPNEWLNDGKSMSWFVRESEWKQGQSKLAQKMMNSNSTSSVILFAKLADRPFCLCGECSVHNTGHDESSNPSVSGWELIEFRLDLLDWEVLKHKVEFRNLVQASTG